MDTRIIDLNVIQKFIERRKKDELSETTIKIETRLLNDFYCWLKDCNNNQLNYEIIANYINSIICGKQYLAKIKLTLYRLYDFIETNNYKIITFRKSNILINDNYNNYVNEYLNIIRNDHDWTTINNKKVFLKLFFKYLEEKRILKLCNLKKYNVTDFLNICTAKYSKAYFNKIAYFIRQYLNYLFTNEIINFTGNDIIPKLNTCYSTPIPTTYTTDEIKNVLNSVNKTTKIGKRDYLILLLLSTYGIRIGDICNLKINSFDFSNNKLSFVQKKTNKILELPLFDEIKYAMIDYYKNSRPNLNSEFLFITYNKPHRKYNKRSFKDIVPKYLKLANINTKNKKTGAHTLRHSLASNMLLNGSNIKHISDILGHNYISTSNLYLTIDIKKLQELSLELPKEVNDRGDLNG